jgi:hypothetical protein
MEMRSFFACFHNLFKYISNLSVFVEPNYWQPEELNTITKKKPVLWRFIPCEWVSNKYFKVRFNCRVRSWLKPLRNRSLLRPAICYLSKWISHTYTQNKNKFKKTNVLLNKTTCHSETLVISHCLCSCEGCLTLMGYADWLFHKFSQL